MKKGEVSLDSNEELTIELLKKINPINDILFYMIFIYTRIYLFGKNVLYNMDLYIKNVSGSVLIDKIGLLSLWTIGLLNYYWFIIANH